MRRRLTSPSRPLLQKEERVSRPVLWRLARARRTHLARPICALAESPPSPFSEPFALLIPPPRRRRHSHRRHYRQHHFHSQSHFVAYLALLQVPAAASSAGLGPTPIRRPLQSPRLPNFRNRSRVDPSRAHGAAAAAAVGSEHAAVVEEISALLRVMRARREDEAAAGSVELETWRGGCRHGSCQGGICVLA